ncbi:MAG: N-acetylmuramoyl-L-alanine amidase [Gammaproteobacteria bacterium]|nr:N-acetylmuramoyl-L-alanine amidase [Gammaproteobacteria bacterium]
MLRLITTYCLLLIFSLPLGAQETARLKNIRVWAAPDNTRVVFDLSGPIRHELKLLSGPYRVVIDLENTAPLARFSYPALRDGHVQEMRHGQHDDFLRIVLDLEQRVKAKSFLLKPNKHYGHRLVVDVTDEQQQQQQQPVIKKRAPATGYRDIVVAVDAGHGGEDPGAIGPHGTYEKTVVLQIARELVKRINKERGMKAALTRTGDYYVPLRKRMELARRQHADLFISIHADAFTNRQVRGSSVYILSSRGASSEHARWLAARENASDLMGGVSLDDKDNQLASVLLDMSQTASEEASIEAAEKVLAGLKAVGKVHKPAVEYAAFAVLKSPDIPSMLIETAFISNPQEEKKLRSSAYQRKLAQAIATGIKRYFQLNPPENTLLAARGTTN